MAQEIEMQKNAAVFWGLASHDMGKPVKFFRKGFDSEIDFNERLGFSLFLNRNLPGIPYKAGSLH